MHPHTMNRWRDDEGYTSIRVRYTFTPGYPETGPSYASGGDPAQGPEIEIEAATLLDGTPVVLTEDEAGRIMAEIAEKHDPSSEWDDF